MSDYAKLRKKQKLFRKLNDKAVSQRGRAMRKAKKFQTEADIANYEAKDRIFWDQVAKLREKMRDY